MNKKTKKIIAILIASIILVSYIAYSDILASENPNNVHVKVLTAKQILSLYHFDNYRSYSYVNQSTLITNGGFYCAYSRIFICNNTSIPGSSGQVAFFIDRMSIFNNVSLMEKFMPCPPADMASGKWNGSVDFTFYVNKCLTNSSFVEKNYNNLHFFLHFYAVNGTREACFEMPGSMIQIYTVYAKLAEVMLKSVKNSELYPFSISSSYTLMAYYPVAFYE